MCLFQEIAYLTNDLLIQFVSFNYFGFFESKYIIGWFFFLIYCEFLMEVRERENV